jgi:hypothetical protein
MRLGCRVERPTVVEDFGWLSLLTVVELCVKPWVAESMGGIE